MRRVGWSLALCFWPAFYIYIFYRLYTEILERYSDLWLIPVTISAFLIGVWVYKQALSPMFKKLIRNDPLVNDRSGETPYEFDNPYTPKDDK